jgi:hypothetical protein
MPETQLLFDLKEDTRSNVFAECRFPLHLLIGASLIEDNSNLFVEQKAIFGQAEKLIWKSRGEPEFYNLTKDPLEIDNVYGVNNRKAEIMMQKLMSWSKLIYDLRPHELEVIGASERKKHELLERLRGIGYIK